MPPPAAPPTGRTSPISRCSTARRGSRRAHASTGEQKALLIGLVLAHAGLVAEMTRLAPLLLLDEVVAHLDPGRRAALYDALAALDTQVWMTGADPAPFADVASRAQMFAVSPDACADARHAPLTSRADPAAHGDLVMPEWPARRSRRGIVRKRVVRIHPDTVRAARHAIQQRIISSVAALRGATKSRSRQYATGTLRFCRPTPATGDCVCRTARPVPAPRRNRSLAKAAVGRSAVPAAPRKPRNFFYNQ